MEKLVQAAERFLKTQEDGPAVADNELCNLADEVRVHRSKRRKTPRERLYTLIHQAIEDDGVILPLKQCRLHRLIDGVVQECERRLGQ